MTNIIEMNKSLNSIKFHDIKYEYESNHNYLRTLDFTSKCYNRFYMELVECST